MTVVVTKNKFGETKDGVAVEEYRLQNESGFSVTVITYGATITSINVPYSGTIKDVVLGFDNMEGYQSNVNPYFGATVGRVANRTSPTSFLLDGKKVSITPNKENDIQLHGGLKGFDKVIWVASLEGNKLIMKYKSVDGEEGYPGNLEATTTYEITNDNALKVSFRATTDQTTIVNLTNHSYFNLAGHTTGAEELLKHEMKIEADNYTKLKNMVANGELVPIAGTGYNFRTPVAIGEAMKKISENGFDVNYCIEPKDSSMKLAATVTYKPHNTKMEVFTTAPGVQFYSSNFIDRIQGKNGAIYLKHSAFCLETQGYPNAVNIESFPSIKLKPGEEYKHDVTYKFSS